MKVTMELIDGLHNLKPKHQQGVVTIGNFDGVHIGHQKILKQVVLTAQLLQLPSILITFEPHPSEFFRGIGAPARLTNLREKWLALVKTNIDYVLCLKFNQQMAGLSADNFIKNILFQQLKIRKIITGDDFHFGHNRQGNVLLLKEKSAAFGFTVQPLSSLLIHTTRVSSTELRNQLAEGNLHAAKHFLGRDYTMTGRVFYGDARGRQLGFPTANILIKRKKAPISGVFAVHVDGIHAQPLLGVANIGTRPTVDGMQLRLEVHLLDFNDNIYGQHLTIKFLHKIREEKRFSSIDDLKRQIMNDVESARTFFSKLDTSVDIDA